MEILNENAIYLGFRAPTPYYDQELTGLYNAWLRRNRSPEQLQKLREPGRRGRAMRPVPRLAASEIAAAPKERYQTEMAFFMDLENGFYQDMSGYLKNTLGVKVPITGTADHSHTEQPLPHAGLALQARHRGRPHLLGAPRLAAARQHPHGQRSAAFHRGATFANRLRRQTLHRQRDQSSLPQRVGQPKAFRSSPPMAASRIGTPSLCTRSSPNWRRTGSRTWAIPSISRSTRSA